MGQWGVLSPELEPDAPLVGLGALMASVDDDGWSWGMLVDDSARWMAAAEGELLELARLGPRLGLASALFLREGMPDRAAVVPGGAVVR